MTHTTHIPRIHTRPPKLDPFSHARHREEPAAGAPIHPEGVELAGDFADDRQAADRRRRGLCPDCGGDPRSHRLGCMLSALGEHALDFYLHNRRDVGRAIDDAREAGALAAWAGDSVGLERASVALDDLLLHSEIEEGA